jgi:superfamily II DNA/RNA helicase
MRKYVHRVGRTARAGRTGDAWTLIEEQEVLLLLKLLMLPITDKALGSIFQVYAESGQSLGESEEAKSVRERSRTSATSL